MGKRIVETVCCIDINVEMDSCIDIVKKCISQWFDKITKTFEHTYISIEKVRVKIITYTNKNVPRLVESRWFEVSNTKGLEPEYMFAYIKRIKCIDSDAETLAFDAIDRAMEVDWTPVKASFRNIFLFTNSICYKLNSVKYTNFCSQNDDGTYSFRQCLVVFAPEVYPWPELYNDFGNMIYLPLSGSLTAEYLDFSLEEIAFGMLDSTEL